MQLTYSLRKLMMASVAVATMSSISAADFHHELQGVKPWTKETFAASEDFHFAIVPDRTGGERKGFFGQAMEALNLMRPDFVMCVGDLVAWGGAKNGREQWNELHDFVNRLEMPFFYTVGNHDIVIGNKGRSQDRERSIELWKEFHGTNTYYNFTYKGCHFIVLDAMEKMEDFPPTEVLSEKQFAWAEREIERHADARWTFIFMHKPLDWISDRWLAFERRIAAYNYTVFCGDWHNHVKAVRHGKNYYMIGTAGGCFDLGLTRDDLRYGILDSITWVTMTTKGPVVANLALSGIHGDEIQRCATSKGWLEAPLDYPSHRALPASTFVGVKNKAIIPTERLKGDGYDWHLRHGIILRQGKCYAAGISKYPAGKHRALLLGDETASGHAADYGKDWVIDDLGFAGDTTGNVLWRIQEGTLLGYEPEEVVVSVGKHNRGVNTEAEIAEACARIVSLVKTAFPKARVKTFGNDAAACPQGTVWTNGTSILYLDHLGWSTSLVERVSGRRLVTGRVPFVRPDIEKKGLQVSTSFRRSGSDTWVWGFPGGGEVELRVTCEDWGFTYEIIRVDVPDMTRLQFGCLRNVVPLKWTSSFSATAHDEQSGLTLRGFDLHTTAIIGKDMLLMRSAEHGAFEGVKAGFAAGPMSTLLTQLQEMTKISGMPHSTAGGAWALTSEQCKGSYLNVNVTAATVDDAIRCAKRGGIDVVHFRERWYACRGHYPVNTNDWPNGLADMKAAVAKIHAAGLRAGMHTLTGCIDPKDTWIHPECRHELMAWKHFTLAEPLTEDAKELTVNEPPYKNTDTLFTYHGNGNAIRIDGEIVQFTGFTKTPPYKYTGLTRGAFKTRKTAHAKGATADYLQQRYIAFYPEPDSQLAKDLAEAIGNVYNTCGFDQIYCDGTEGMMTSYGMQKMRMLILDACTRQGRACLTEDSAGGGPSGCWWYQSRAGAWDSTYWAAKRFHDFHVRNMKRAQYRERNFIENQMGWWTPCSWSPHCRPHYVDDIEYYAGKNAALDASMSIVWWGLRPGAVPDYNITRQVTVLGWYERFRRAGAFAEGVTAKLDVPRAEYELRQSATDGRWMMRGFTNVTQRVYSPESGSWNFTATEAPTDAKLRVEALYYASAKPGQKMIDATKPEALKVTTAGKTLTARVSRVTDEAGKAAISFAAENAGEESYGAWAKAVMEYPAPYQKINNNRVLTFRVKGDGSGALLNVQVTTPREFGLTHSEHYVKLDFTGWRTMQMPFRETDAEQFCDYKWPYSGGYAEVFHRVINMNHVSEVALWLNEVPAGGKAEVQVSDVCLTEQCDGGFAKGVLTVNGVCCELPFAMKSGEIAEYEKGVWTRYDRTMKPIERRVTGTKVPLKAGVNTCSFAADCTLVGLPTRAEVSVLAYGAPFVALKDVTKLPADKRKLLAYETADLVTYRPEAGFDTLPPFCVRPGEKARPTFCVYGPIDAFTLTIGKETRSFPAVAEKGVLFCEKEFPAMSGVSPVSIKVGGKPNARFEFAAEYE